MRGLSRIAGVAFVVVPAALAAQSGSTSVSSQMSLFLAGGNTYSVTPNASLFPGQGGGITPFVLNLTDGVGRILTVSATGTATFCANSTCGTTSPDGPAIFGTSINSSGKISGLTVPLSSGFLAGLFLGPSLPSSAPLALNISDLNFSSLSPLLGQTFFIGNGFNASSQQQQFLVPDAATQLYFGIVDGGGFGGNPGYYDDNAGSYATTYNVVGRPTSSTTAPEPASLALVAAGMVALFAAGRRRA
jgi:hypothetical protein